MKKLYKINEYASIITLLLYLTFWGGIFAQAILGVIQIIMSIIIIINFNALNNYTKSLFIIYIILTLGSIISIKLINQDLQNGRGMAIAFIFLVISAFLALFHLGITYEIKQQIK